MAKKTIPAIHETELDDEKPMSFRRMWLAEHKVAVFTVAAIVLIALIFFGIRWYNNFSHPLTKFMNASAKNFNDSFSFNVEMEKDGEIYMRYKGAYEANSGKQELKALYDADYGSYAYTGAVFSEGDTRICGNLYDGKWRVRDCTEKVLNFFDFNTDYRGGSFDGASFLRFTGLTSDYNYDELNRFMKIFKDQMNGSTPLASVEITSKDGAKTYSYQIDMTEFFNLVRDKGASIFFSALDYDAFCALYLNNDASIKQSDCHFSYTINSGGWLEEIRLTLTAGGETFSAHCTMDSFGEAQVEIPKEFLNAKVSE